MAGPGPAMRAERPWWRGGHALARQTWSLTLMSTGIRLSLRKRSATFCWLRTTSSFIGSTTTDVYDAQSGSHQRSIENIGTTPTLLITP